MPIQSRPGSSFVTKAATPHPFTGATLTGKARQQAEEREAHILGDGPRLQPIELNEVSSGLLKILERMETVNGGSATRRKPSLLPWAASAKQEPSEVI